MRAVLYARVSTADKDQDPETQLGPLRREAERLEWEVVGEYVDHASADDLARRKQWRRLLDDAARRHFDVVFIWKLDRAFRNVYQGAQFLETYRPLSIGIKSLTEPIIDTTSPMGEAMYYITLAWAKLEKDGLILRVKAGMDRARRQGQTIGRPTRVQSVDWEYVAAEREKGKGWRKIAANHPKVQTANGAWQPSEALIRQQWARRNGGGSEGSESPRKRGSLNGA